MKVLTIMFEDSPYILLSGSRAKIKDYTILSRTRPYQQILSRLLFPTMANQNRTRSWEQLLAAIYYPNIDVQQHGVSDPRDSDWLNIY